MKNFVSYFLKDSAEIFQGLHISGEVIAVYSFENETVDFVFFTKFNFHDIYCYFICILLSFTFFVHFTHVFHRSCGALK